MVQTWLMFADLGPHDSSGLDPVNEWFQEISIDNQFVVYNEVSKDGKEHIHACFVTETDKKNTITKKIIASFPELKAARKGRGGSHKYGCKRYPQDYNSNNYDEYPQDYILKDNHHRCGGLWGNTNSNLYHSSSVDMPLPSSLDYPEFLARKDRFDNYESQHKSSKKKITDASGNPVPNKESLDVRLQKHLQSLLKQDIRYFLEDGLPSINQELLTDEIIKFYECNGKPSNRNIYRVIAEQVIWYAPVCAQADSSAKKERKTAINNEIQKILYPQY